ncbi:Na/Pi cotransporter family protein [Pelagibacterium lacus]|uniref:Na/Pi cotransporter family protein n=1 Tax=Pelagibacterium lacus TaxID=2282655 RepID=A0A369W2T9_9HYPH|nr:Na/Pi cotransporter family protein [Pelagibacterium lacus]
MSSTLVLIDLLGAGALLLWGLRLIKTGMLRAFGTSLRYWIGKSTRNRVSAVVVGILATLAVQSSTATAVITASFAARDLVSGLMAQAIMLGANIGTSLAAVILSLDLHWLSPVLILVGVVTFNRSRYAAGKGVGRAILGLGLMLLALALMGQATEPVRTSDIVIYILAHLGGAPVFALLFAAGLAFLASSSLAVVLFVVLLGQAGIVSPELALVLVAGANLGGAVPPYLAVYGEGVEARRLAATNLAIRAFGAFALTGLAGVLGPVLHRIWPDTGVLALSAHIGFSTVLLVVFLPVLGPLARLAEKLIPDAPEGKAAPRYLDESALATPALALSAAARETLRLGDMVREMLEASMIALKSSDPAVREQLAEIENDIDRVHGEIKIYLSRLAREELDEEDSRRATEIMSYAVNLEHIGDIIDSGLSELAAKKAKRRLAFSAEGLAEIVRFYDRTLEILDIAQSVFLSRDADLARQLAACKSEVRRLETESAERHLERLRARRTETLETSGLHLDILRDLKRVNAHLISVAYPILDDMGALRDTRLRPSSKT